VKILFGRGIKLFTLFGFKVSVDATWLIIALLVTLTLAKGVFPLWYKGLSVAAYWWMGIAGALGLFASIVFHEFFHSIVARKYGLPMKGITLFIFGGVAEMEDQPRNPKTEFFMAIAGPLSSIFLGFLFYGMALIAEGALPAPVSGVIGYLSYINFILAAFNLIPAFPMDGGRVLRSALWKWKGNIRWATRIASSIGSGFGLFLIVVGILDFFRGNPIGGLWLFLIGMFIRSTSQMSYHQVLLQKMLEGETVRRFLKENPVTVPMSATVSELLEDYFYKYHYKMFPVTEQERLAGCVTMDRVKDVPREQRDSRRVGDLVQKCTPDNSVHPSTDAMKALRLMDKSGNDKLMVVRDGRLEGIVTRNDILRFFGAKMEFGESEKNRSD
jgi:Zn-dependent protease/CBS domain-containing protein